MKEIQLTQGKVALVDDEDFEYLNQFKWYGSSYFVRCSLPRVAGKQPSTDMHTLIMGRGRINFKNGDPLDNQRKNLRFATKSQEGAVKGLFKNNTSGFKGVCRCGNKWRSYIKGNGRHVHLGVFSSAQLAHEAYERAAIFYFGEFANAA